MRAASLAVAVAGFLAVVGLSVRAGASASASASALASASASWVVAPAQLGAAPYAEWAHEHWVWLSSDRANQSSMLAYAQEYLAHDIPVGAVDIDSAWTTGFNNFVIDTAKYPDAGDMIAQFHGMGMRVIFWMTSMIDTDSSNYAEAISNKFYVANAFGEPGIIKWWHGHGVLLDYTNPSAVAWWHAQQLPVMQLGLDGWKTDGTDPYMMELIVARGSNGTITYREYADMYYGDCFDYMRQINGPTTLIMSRPVDGWPPIYLPYSPRRVVFSGWIGDNDPTWDGLVDAMKKLLQSGWHKYPAFGCDIGGYRSGQHTAEVFTRWFQLGAWLPLMENGGNDEHRPWMFDPPGLTNVSDCYRRFANLHTALVPYLLTTGTDAYENGGSSVVPLAPDSTFQQQIIDLFDPPTWDYYLGPAVFVSPIATPAGNVLSLVVSFPLVAGGGWVNWFDAARVVYTAGQNLTFDAPMDTYPAFYCVGCIVPLRVRSDDTGKGPRVLSQVATSRTAGYNAPSAQKAALTLFVNRPLRSGGAYSMRQFQGRGVTMRYEWVADAASAADGVMAGEPDALVLSVTASDEQVVVLLEDVVPDADMTVSQNRADGSVAKLRAYASAAELSADALSQGAAFGGGVWFDAAAQQLFIRPAAPELGVRVTVSGVHNRDFVTAAAF